MEATTVKTNLELVTEFEEELQNYDVVQSFRNYFMGWMCNDVPQKEVLACIQSFRHSMSRKMAEKRS